MGFNTLQDLHFPIIVTLVFPDQIPWQSLVDHMLVVHSQAFPTLHQLARRGTPPYQGC